VNCRRVRMLLSAYLDSELTGCEMLTIRHHISGCPECEAELDSLREVKNLLAALPIHVAGSEVMNSLNERLTYESLSWFQKMELLFSHSMSGEGFIQGRRIVSTFALSGLALVLLTGAFDRPGSGRMASLSPAPSFAPFAHPGSYQASNFHVPSFSDVHFLDPNRHPADLPSDGNTQFVNIEPQERYNSVTMMSFLPDGLNYRPSR